MKDNDMPTYKEYKEAVMKYFSENKGIRTDEEVRDFLPENEDELKMVMV